jgi:hypothetical protein
MGAGYLAIFSFKWRTNYSWLVVLLRLPSLDTARLKLIDPRYPVGALLPLPYTDMGFHQLVHVYSKSFA